MRWILCFFLCGTVFAAAHAGELTHTLHPMDQPLAVVRADSADLFNDMAATRQARAFGLDREDFSGMLPGTDVSVTSLRGFLNALAQAGTRNLWYCLMQDGGTLARQTGGFGWEQDGIVDADGAALEAQDLGLQGGLIDRTTLDSGATRIMLSRDDDTTHAALTGGAFRRIEPWRTDLLRFLDRRDGMAGVLANSRPLSGMLSLAAGIDFRSELARFGLRFPVSVQLELFANGGDLGFETRLNGFVPKPAKAAAGRRELLNFQKDPLLEVHFPAPELLRRHLPFDTGVLAFANLDASALMPQTVNITLWRKPGGAPAWAVVCLVADRGSFRTQLRRIEEWAEALARGGAPLLEITDAVSPDGHALRVLRGDAFELALGLADAEGGAGYFIVSGSAEDWVNPRTIHKQNAAGGERLMRYRSTLDAAGKTEAAEALASFAQRFGRDVPAEVWEEALPEKDSGYLSIDDESLVLMSRNGLLPFLVPWFAGFLQ